MAACWTTDKSRNVTPYLLEICCRAADISLLLKLLWWENLLPAFLLITESSCACTTSTLLLAAFKLTEIKSFKTYLWACNFQQDHQTAHIFLRQTLFQHLVDSVNLQPELVGWIFLCSCLNLLQRRCKVRFRHTIMTLTVLELETSYVPVRDLTAFCFRSNFTLATARFIYCARWARTWEAYNTVSILHSTDPTAQKALWCSLCCCHQPCLTELWGHLAFCSFSGSILTNNLDSFNVPCTHHCLLFQYTVPWGWLGHETLWNTISPKQEVDLQMALKLF